MIFVQIVWKFKFWDLDLIYILVKYMYCGISLWELVFSSDPAGHVMV